ncbi:NAD(P)-binding protein [Phanerochaete sordida]|uniref:NAD(P)-binding protein n=1 Tax=Phanerochaete sordida TaxID=48140 RepID=A0A9P3LM32_9APHY|nr:NAD(P)-binding protein [Phanerochaete sordida]
MARLQELKYKLAAIREHWPPKATFSVNHIPDLRGRVCLVTGGYSGIGKEIAKALLERNARVYVAGRSPGKAQAVIEELRELTGNTGIFLDVDFSSLASVRNAGRIFLERESDLHMLFLNAAVMGVPVAEVTPDGYDMQFGTNVVGPWYFAKLLMPALLRGKASSLDGHARIITTSSADAYLSSIHWGTFIDSPARKKLDTMTLYFQSKLATTIVARQLAEHYGTQGIISIAANPGEIQTDLARNSSTLYRWISSFLLYPTHMGALAPLFAGTSPDALKYNGEYLAPWGRLARSRHEVYDQEIGQRLWKWLEEQVDEHT